MYERLSDDWIQIIELGSRSHIWKIQELGVKDD